MIYYGEVRAFLCGSEVACYSLNSRDRDYVREFVGASERELRRAFPEAGIATVLPDEDAQ